MKRHLSFSFAAVMSLTSFVGAAEVETLPGTEPLTMKGDIAAQLVAGVDKFLLRKIDESVAGRAKYWKRDFSSAEAYNKSIEPNRKRLAHILGVRDPRVPFDAPELVGTTTQPALVGKGDGYNIYAVRWPVLGFPGPTWKQGVSIYGEGLLLEPTKGKPIADIIAIPDADQTPEQIAGLTKGIAPESQFARRLAESGCRVIVPTLVSRQMSRRNGRANLSNREYLYRSAFELGRHLIGYEVQKALACVDWFAKEAKRDKREAKIGLIGYGEGGMIALYAGALDTRILTTCVSGHFGPRKGIWKQPLDRNVFGLLTEFGDAELASMISPRRLVLDVSKGPELILPEQGGAPASLVTPNSLAVAFEGRRALLMVETLGFELPWLHFCFDKERGDARPCIESSLDQMLEWLASDAEFAALGKTPTRSGKALDVAMRQRRQVEQIDRHNQWLLRESPYVRRQFMSKLDFSSVAAYEKSVEHYRKIFYDEVIGRFDEKPLPFNARTRKTYGGEKWDGYEVVLDVFPDVIAYGILCLPKDLKKGEKRPVVVCQHGLEGRPQSVIGEKDYHYYKAFAAKLASRGFITFAPQNLYIGGDKFRTLQRKANPLGKTLFSIIVPQHQQIVDWLKTQPNVDPQRIAFYGLSYGGKSAMRIPPLVKDYCLSICSADFNEWVDKNASTRNPRSYIWTGEYEIFEWDLGSTFNYAEMAALIAPRPFMVERGHFDGVGDDWTVAWEFAKVRHLYAAKLKLPDRCQIEWFVGPHSINEKGTYDFLHKHLNWPKR